MPDPHLYLGWVSHEHALEDLGEVPQVEGIVRLSRSGQQLGGDGGIHHDSGFYEWIHTVGNVRGSSCGDRRVSWVTKAGALSATSADPNFLAFASAGLFLQLLLLSLKV